MGHLTLISEDVILALEHYPPELRLILAQYAPQPEWDDYVGGRYHETKERDTSLLGGGKPSVSASDARGAGKWRVDEADTMGASTSAVSANNSVQISDVPKDMKGEFRRVSKLTRETSADFGVAPLEVDEDGDGGDSAGHTQVSMRGCISLCRCSTRYLL
jgi:serine/threonine-protein phosphatase 6 regulatory subunit 3